MRRHPIISQKTFYLNRIKQVKLSSDLRTETAQIFLTCKFNAIHKYCKQLNAEPEIDESVLFDAVTNMISEYEDSTLKIFEKKYKDLADDIFDIFYRQNFKELHDKNVYFINNFIHLQSNSMYDNEVKKDTFFTLCLTAFELAMFDVERSFRRINGKFTDIEFKLNSAKAKTLFISYSHKDELFKTELAKHLQPLIKQGKITIWDDLQIRAGANWKKDIENAVLNADVFVALVSADYIASEYCYVKELEQAMKNIKTSIVPILVRSCAANELPLFNYQILPRNAVPVASFTDKDQAYTEIVNEIKKII